MLAECYFFTGMTLVPDLVPVGSALVPGSACSKIAVNNSIWALVPGLVPVGSGSGVLRFPVQASLAKSFGLAKCCELQTRGGVVSIFGFTKCCKYQHVALSPEHDGLPKCCKYACIGAWFLGWFLWFLRWAWCVFQRKLFFEGPRPHQML